MRGSYESFVTAVGSEPRVLPRRCGFRSNQLFRTMGLFRPTPNSQVPCSGTALVRSRYYIRHRDGLGKVRRKEGLNRGRTSDGYHGTTKSKGLTMTIFIISGIVIIGFLLWTARRNLKPPRVQSEQELIASGYTARQAKIEARQQRAEHRSYVRTQNSAAKAGSQVARALFRRGKRY